MSANYAGRTITLLILFLIVVIASVVIFLYFEGYIGPSSSSTSFAFSGTFSISPGGGSGGAFGFSMQNTGKAPINSFAFACPTSEFSQSNCNGVVATYHGAPVSAQNPLLIGGTAVVSGPVTAAFGTVFTASHIYSVTITAVSSNGATSTVTEQLPAQG